MLTTNASLGQIAIKCGLADQPHLNKLFRRLVGESPGDWRRERAGAIISSFEALGDRCMTARANTAATLGPMDEI
jgi:AraC-like DNA-binding protein